MSRRIIAAILLFASAAQSRATDRFWTGLNGGTFSTGGNWRGGIAPGSSDVAHFDISGGTLFTFAYTVSFTNNPTNSAMRIEGGDFVTFSLGSHVYTTTNSAPLSIGLRAGRTGALTITGGTVAVPFQSDVAVGVFGAGQLTVSTGGLLAGTANVFVGLSGGNSMLTMQNNGDIIANDVFLAADSSSNSTATVTGAGSSLLASALSVGQRGTAALNVTANGRVDSASGIVGDQAGSSGSANVNGTGSLWTNSGDCTVGKSGAGTLNITGGGRVDNRNGFLGNGGGSGTATVSGAGSQWINSGALQVGLFGQGFLEITAGGHVQTPNGNIGGVNHSGEVTVSGAGSTWNGGVLNIGYTGLGELTIETGGSVSSTGASIGLLTGSVGTATLTGATSAWTNGGNLSVGDQGTGILHITSGAMTNSGSLTVGNAAMGTLTIMQGGGVSDTDGHLGVSSGITATVTIDGANSKWINSGELRVGESGSGTLTITSGGSVQNTNGFLGAASGAGTANIDGATSQWINSGILQVGLSGPGTLNITGGAHVQSNGGNIAVNGSSNSTAKVSGSGSTWTSGGMLGVGLSGTGQLTIEQGASVGSSGAVIGSLGGSSGTVNVADAASMWTNTGSLAVGDHGAGTLTITGGSVSNTGSLTVGNAATGTLKVTQGGSISSTAGDIGVSAGSTGKVTVDTSNSQWINSGDLRVGEAGSGTLNIVAGGSVQNANCFISSGLGGGIVNITGAASQWINSGILQIGLSGPGTLNITASAHVQNIDSNIAISSNSNSTAKVSGAGSTWTNSGVLNVGLGGTGQLTIDQGGHVTSASATIGTVNGSNGTATLSGTGSLWNVSGRLSIGGDATSGSDGGVGTLRIQPGASLSVTQDTQLFNGDLLSLEGGTLTTSKIDFQGNGAFQWTSGTLHVGIYHGSLTNPNAGVLAPGNSAGKTTVTSNYTQQAGATLQIEIGGTSAGNTYDLVNVSGATSLGGQLQLALLSGFDPSAADVFTVLQTTAISGAFSNAANGQRLTTTDGLASFIVNYGPGSPFHVTELVLSDFQPGSRGDVNRDGHVNVADVSALMTALADLTAYQSSHGPGGALTNQQLLDIADLTGDNLVTNADLQGLIVLLASGGAGSISTVPEPGTIGLALLGAAVVGLAIRKRASGTLFFRPTPWTATGGSSGSRKSFNAPREAHVNACTRLLCGTEPQTFGSGGRRLVCLKVNVRKELGDAFTHWCS